MKLNKYPNLLQALKGLKKRGFRDEFKFKDNQLINLRTNRAYDPDQMMIVEHHRFEGMTNPSDMSILFAVETEDGDMGQVVSSYGPYSDIKLLEFLDKVKIKRRENVA